MTTTSLPPREAARPGPERIFAELLAEVLRVERVAVDSHFFDELGADSLVMAQFCARVRKRGGLPSISMKDVYAHPTIRSLATSIAERKKILQQETLPIWVFNQLTKPRYRPVTNIVAMLVIAVTTIPILLANRLTQGSAEVRPRRQD